MVKPFFGGDVGTGFYFFMFPFVFLSIHKGNSDYVETSSDCMSVRKCFVRLSSVRVP
jgi:hypothetical protein